MFEEIANFFKMVHEVWDKIKQGIRIGEALSDDDVDGALNGLLGSTHFAAWNDIIGNENLTSGQYELANMCMDGGSDYLDSLGSAMEYNPSDYRQSCFDAADGSREALSASVQQASTAVTHAANSTVSGMGKFLGSFGIDA